jgi:hypothetical protein
MALPLIPIAIIAGIGFLMARAKGAGAAAGSAIGAAPFTFGVMQLVKGKSYHFETEMGGMSPEQAPGVLSGLQAAGAWDIYVAPTTPLLVSYSQRCTTTQALSVGVPYPVEGEGPARTFTAKSVREVATPAARLAA